MKKWIAVIVLGAAQFVMVLDSTVMNVSISTVVKDLDTSVAAMQSAITFYTLTMAAAMLLGAKLGDVWGRRRAFVVGSIVYACGSLITGLSPNITTLFLGWSVIEGLGAVLVIPAIAALIATNYTGRDRVTAFALIGAVSGAAVAAGPLIGGFVTTYFDWRYVFFAEVVIMVAVLFAARFVADPSRPQKTGIDLVSVALSAVGLVAVVYGLLQSKTWGWILPLHPPVVNGVSIEPLGLSLVPYFVVGGAALLWAFVSRQKHLVARGRVPLIHPALFSITPLRAGLSVLGAQYAITAAIFFVVPVYLQMTLGLDALETGLRIFPLSIALILFSIVGTRLSDRWSPRLIARIAQVVLVVSGAVLLASLSLDLRNVLFAVGMFSTGAALGLLASQLGNVNMSSVGENETSEVGGLQGVFQNLGSSLGTALIGSVLIASLAGSFAAGVQSSDLPSAAKSAVSSATSAGVEIVPVAGVDAIVTKAGLSEDDAATLTTIYADSQVSSLRVSFVVIVLLALVSLVLSRNLPSRPAGQRDETAEVSVDPKPVSSSG
ncbi:MFS transporter [Agromyces atrinae]|nr:MFS transporter [Agromyces atrinae]NYD68829.1 MFS family permease [Agromyces atrinae]